MTATAPTRIARQDCTVSLIPSPFSGTLLRLLGCSRWPVDQLPDVQTALRQIEAGHTPILVCGPKDWHAVLEVVRRTARPPEVIVLTDVPNDLEWLAVIQAGAHYLPIQKLDVAELCSLLNLLWRGWNKSQ